MTDRLTIPDSLLPVDGRFGAGPSKVREEQMGAVARAHRHLLGTSHRQAPVRGLVGGIREGLAEFLRLPDGYEILLGMGGASAFWDAAALGLVRERAQHAAFGEFGAKFAEITGGAPFLQPSSIRRAEPGSRTEVRLEDGIDVYAWPQNETSTGVASPVRRPEGLAPARTEDDPLVVIDATSAAGGMAVELSETDVYYFSPQKNFASDGGLWFGAFSPAAIARIESIAASGRWIPAFLSLQGAVENSRKDQTYNTPALATLVMLDEQVRWLNEQGGMDWAAARTAGSSSLVYDWAEAHPLASPFAADPEHRSPVVAAVDFDEAVDASALSAALRRHGIVDVEPYRKLGRNQLRIGTFTAVEPSDVRKLLACLDALIDQL
ncbi:phosphoserine transaminase [Kocuria palustris]|uniref:phosphoserine transaminase n=1 Tax=Kocuria palustris TaxID=71999 RepID=UPI0011A1F79E|nr:phosphoserine transaminase [Kocuria palustris]